MSADSPVSSRSTEGVRQLVILAGGQGTRLRSVVGDVPKPMAKVGDKPILEHQIDLAKRFGFHKVLFLTSYRSEVIESYFGHGERFGLELTHAVDEVPLGTGGALLGQLEKLEPRFMVLYGDVMLDVDLERMWNWHLEKKAEASLLIHPNDHPHDSDLVETDLEGRIMAFHGYPHPPDSFLPNKVNAALYIFEKKSLERWFEGAKKEDIAKHLFPKMLAAGQKLMGYASREYIKDMGTPERLAKVNRDWLSGKIQRLNRRHPLPAVFLDRDGTINREVNWLKSPEQLELLPGVSPALQLINNSAHLSVVVTNQPVIARGDCDEIGLAKIHAKLETLLGQGGAYLDAIYYCPHHPDKGFAGERSELKISCDCRKPAPGLFTRAANDLHIDLAQSWMVGDTLSDMEAARRLGLHSALVQTGYAGSDGKYQVAPDFTFLNLHDAAQFIVGGYDRLQVLLRSLTDSLREEQIVLIGGLARCGKTIVATVLEKMLRAKGYGVLRISLDGFLRPLEERGKTVRQRYDLPKINQLIARLLSRPHSGPVSWKLGHYDRAHRQVVEDQFETVIAERQIVLMEGVVALEVEPLDHPQISSLFVELPEEIRKRRFFEEYLRRGYTSLQIENLYQERESDEVSLIRSGRTRAKQILTPT